MEWWNGMVEWNSEMEWCNGMVELTFLVSAVTWCDTTFSAAYGAAPRRDARGRWSPWRWRLRDISRKEKKKCNSRNVKRLSGEGNAWWMAWDILSQGRHLFGELLDDIVDRHLAANVEAAFDLRLDRGQQFLLVVRREFVRAWHDDDGKKRKKDIFFKPNRKMEEIFQAEGKMEDFFEAEQKMEEILQAEGKNGRNFWSRVKNERLFSSRVKNEWRFWNRVENERLFSSREKNERLFSSREKNERNFWNPSEKWKTFFKPSEKWKKFLQPSEKRQKVFKPSEKLTFPMNFQVFFNEIRSNWSDSHMKQKKFRNKSEIGTLNERKKLKFTLINDRVWVIFDDDEWGRTRGLNSIGIRIWNRRRQWSEIWWPWYLFWERKCRFDLKFGAGKVSLATRTWQWAGRRGIQGGHLEQPQGLVDMLDTGKGQELHLGQRLGNSHHRFQLTNGDGNGRRFLPVLAAHTAAHQHVAMLELFRRRVGQTWTTISKTQTHRRDR